MNIYLDNGYLDFEKIINTKCAFIFIIGGRGTGKTFGAIKYAYENNKEFIFMRRTQTQVEVIARPEYSPFNALNRVIGTTIETRKSSRYTGDISVGDKTIGNILALSTISNLRGFSSNAEILIYDEFIPEPHEKPIKAEGSAFFNAYETINRNRELEGRPPLQCLCLSNSNTLKNPILEELNLVDILEKKKRKGATEYINQNRGIAVFLLDESEISKKKKETALYKAVQGSKFFDMAISNTFAEDNPENIKSQKLDEYAPFINVIGEFVIYKHKSEKRYYISKHLAGKPAHEFNNNKIDIKRVRRQFPFLFDKRLRNNIYFESYQLQIKFDNFLNI